MTLEIGGYDADHLHLFGVALLINRTEVTIEKKI
jgi:hypothetical protein